MFYLVFQDCFKLPILSILSKMVRKTYLLFGSGAMHAPYAIFQKHSRMGGEVIA
jgi:hypothetical protein